MYASAARSWRWLRQPVRGSSSESGHRTSRPVHEASAQEYFGRAIRRLVRLFWRGQIFRTEFVTELMFLIQKGFLQAWNLGMKDVGLSPDEITPQETDRLFKMMSDQYSYVQDWAQVVYENRREIGGKLQDLWGKLRVSIWVNRFDHVRTEGKLSGKNDPKQKWVMNPAKENCKSCKKLDGKVKRKSYWIAKGVQPGAGPGGVLPNPMLA